MDQIPYQELSFDTDINDLASIQDGGARSSSESSDGFSFPAPLNNQSTANDPRKNLTAAFDQQVAKPSSSSSCSSAMSVVTASTWTAASQQHQQQNQQQNQLPSVVNRIAQFEAASKSKPPLPLKQQSNSVPTNRLAVYLRIRPTTPNKSASTSTIEVLKAKHPNIHPTTVRTYPPADSNATKIHSHRSDAQEQHAKQFEFHQVLTPETTQKTVYSMVATPLLNELLDATLYGHKKSPDPQSALLFSYGITNAGKTHTILGDLKSKNDAKWGIIPRAISDILDRKKQMQMQIPKMARQQEVDLYMSFFEIYNEQVFDLIPKEKQSTMVGAFPPSLKISERHGQTIVRGLAKHKVRDIQHGIDLTLAANHRRHTSSNNLNSDSSRSHCVCQMQLVPRATNINHNVSSSNTRDDDSVVSVNGGYSTDEEANRQRNVSTIWIVDLAGSERSKRTQMGIARQKEASQINKSLMTLMRCLTVMRTNNSSTGRSNSSSSSSSSNNVIPFRESKLSHVFMGHLTGSSAARTAMIVNVNPSVGDFDETQHVLGYAASAKLIQIDPTELQEKRKQYFGSDGGSNDEYGMDGHKKKRKPSHTTTTTTTSTTSGNHKTSGTLLSKVVKGLSPKKLLKKWGKTEKRKVPFIVGGGTKFSNNNGNSTRPPLVKHSSASSLNGSNHSHGNEPAMKRQRAGSVDMGVHQAVSSSSVATATLAPVATTITISSVDRTETKLAKQALAQAKLEIEQLRSEKEELLEELATQEGHIRLEVSQEMEERLRLARERHTREVERLRAQIPNNAVLLASTRKAQRDHAERHLEELMDKVDECEDEIKRMRHQHEQEITKLKESHATEIARLEAQLASSKEEGGISAKRVADLETDLQASRSQVERLKRSKLELVENYEKLLQEQKNKSQKEESSDDDQDNEEEEDEDEDDGNETDEQDEENQVPLWKQKMTRSNARKVLGTISGNSAVLTSTSEKVKGGNEQFLFPKVASAQENDGLYRRPIGRAPTGREWDASVGAWKLVV